MDVGQNGRPLRGPQMEMSSLVLTIQLLRYLILTHAQVYFRALDIQQSVRMRTGWIRTYSDSEASLRYFWGQIFIFSSCFTAQPGNSSVLNHTPQRSKSKNQ